MLVLPVKNRTPDRPPENLVEVRDLHFSYEDNAVLKGVNLAIPRGKVVAILGVSGCGKSTLLRHFGGQLKPSRGSVTFDGQVVHELGNKRLYALRRKMGMMFQVSGLFSDLSVYENLAYPMREHTDLPEDVIHDLVLMKLHAVGLRGAHALRTGELSGGMARRVALARAIALDPMLIMYDEPFAGLDPISLNTIAELIRHLNDALGLTSVLVTYDVPESLKIADYVYFLHEGVVVAEGDVAEITDSKDPFVQQFVHAAPDGPVAFQYPSRPFPEELDLAQAEPPDESA
ncbi:MAG: ATP-binding cassette domain-containing protein [Thiobacillus sp.]|nr:ATP-binding cassette domain-containing protein [Thiobacillus sp.]